MPPTLAPPEIDMPIAPSAPQRISFADYLRQYDSIEGVRSEWNAGVVEIYTMANNFTHNELLSFLQTLLRIFLDLKKLGRIVIAGVPMYVGDEQPAREPDLMVLLNAHLDRLTPQYVNGAADVAVEIVSPESDERDRGKKFLEYEAAGVPEYWLIDPIRRQVAFYMRGEDGRYQTVTADAQGRVASRILPGFVLDPGWLWHDLLPGGAEIYRMALAMADEGG
jgi:Uma2 family endonuclease